VSPVEPPFVAVDTVGRSASVPWFRATQRPHPAAEAIAQEQLDLTVVLERVARVVIVAAVALVGEYNEAHVLAGAAKPESMCEASLAFVREPRESVANLRRFI